jgi:hypothetical protein
MKVVQLGRNDLYVVLSMTYKAMAIAPKVIELGVLRGDNALVLHRTLSPSLMVLIDAWSAEAATQGYCPFDELPAWVNPVDTYDYYFGGSVREQRTYDAIHDECVSKFKDLANVVFLRYATIDALAHIKPNTGANHFDLVYVDANHQYEYVLRDLMRYQEIVAENGCIMLNDCCHSSAGTLQNLGVLEAVSSFLKRSDFRPVALTNTDWSDLILVRKGSAIGQLLDYTIANSDIAYVEIPDQLLPAGRIIDGKQRKNISFA